MRELLDPISRCYVHKAGAIAYGHFAFDLTFKEQIDRVALFKAYSACAEVEPQLQVYLYR